MPGSRLHFRAAGFALVTGERWGADHFATFAPAWFWVGIALLLPAAWAGTRLRRLRMQGRAHRCPTCRYDLRATPDRCPECGTAPAAAAEAPPAAPPD